MYEHKHRKGILMKTIYTLLAVCLISIIPKISHAQEQDALSASMYDLPPRWLVDLPTAGTLPRGYYDIGFRIYPGGGSIVNTDIGLSNRLTIGISYGGDKILSNETPIWNPSIEFNLKFRLIDELEYFPGISVGFASQGNGTYISSFERYTFKSRGFYVVASRSFYFYQWTAGWHFGINYSQENDFDKEDDLNFFGGFDATFKYNLALIAEYDLALNDDRSMLPDKINSNIYGGKGRGYFNIGIKWLFTDNLELEAIVKDIFINRRDSEAITREIRINYIDRF